MDNNSKHSHDNHVALPDTTVSALRSRQSVRATFKLTPQSIEAISIISIHLGIKQKSLFDHLIEDSRALNTIVREIDPGVLQSKHRIQKTYVISRKSLFSLENMSKEFNMPRDVLVEYSIQRLLPVITVEKKKHKRRIEIFAELSEHYRKGLDILRRCENTLEGDDPVCDKLEKLMAGYENIYYEIESLIKKGEIIENF
ncbi:MAG: hypothetical protein AB1427_01535 [Thermodesulfobacteriota bacterium]